MTVDPARLKESWARVAAHGDQAAAHFYSWLFLAHPHLRSMFEVSMAGQRDKLLAALGHIVSHVDDLEVTAGFAAALGRDHRKFEVEPGHYPAVGTALLSTLAYFEGEDWTAELAADWETAYGLISQVMIEAAAQAAATTPPWWDAEVIGHQRRLPDLAVITVRPSSAVPYTPGQSMFVETALRPRAWRLLSPANAPRADGTIEFHVRSIVGGAVSPALVHSLRIGDTLRLGAPLGTRLTLAGAAGRDLLLVACGTGLAPLRALVEQLAANARAVHPPKTALLVAARGEHELYDRAVLDALVGSCPWLTAEYTVPPPAAQAEDPAEPTNMADHVAQCAAAAAGSGWLVYVCGSAAVNAATERSLLDVGVPRRDIRIEQYDNHRYGKGEAGPAPAPPDHTGVEAR
jgi:NAD(P)H-flavin reductase/hemoglobin-like flavoprotein